MFLRLLDYGRANYPFWSVLGLNYLILCSCLTSWYYYNLVFLNRLASLPLKLLYAWYERITVFKIAVFTNSGNLYTKYTELHLFFHHFKASRVKKKKESCVFPRSCSICLILEIYYIPAVITAVLLGVRIVIGKISLLYDGNSRGTSLGNRSPLSIHKMFDVEIILQILCKLPFYLSALIVKYSAHINAM